MPRISLAFFTVAALGEVLGLDLASLAADVVPADNAVTA